MWLLAILLLVKIVSISLLSGFSASRFAFLTVASVLLLLAVLFLFYFKLFKYVQHLRWTQRRWSRQQWHRWTTRWFRYWWRLSPPPTWIKNTAVKKNVNNIQSPREDIRRLLFFFSYLLKYFILNVIVTFYINYSDYRLLFWNIHLQDVSPQFREVNGEVAYLGYSYAKAELISEWCACEFIKKSTETKAKHNFCYVTSKKKKIHQSHLRGSVKRTFRHPQGFVFFLNKTFVR